jgi:hypothetical protein
MLLCRDTSRILNTVAPRRAAPVRKPALRECAPKSAVFSPIAYSTQSAHFCTSSLEPHGITGTEEVEFFGEPSMSLSE